MQSEGNQELEMHSSLGWGCSSVVEYLPNMCKALSSISSTAKNVFFTYLEIHMKVNNGTLSTAVTG
jgi:hypothetical protein